MEINERRVGYLIIYGKIFIGYLLITFRHYYYYAINIFFEIFNMVDFPQIFILPRSTEIVNKPLAGNVM